MQLAYRFSEEASPDITINWSLWKCRVRLTADGTEIQPARGRRFVVPMRDGGRRIVEVRTGLDLSPVLVTDDGTSTRLLPRLAWWRLLLIFLPVIAWEGGALGGLFAGFGILVNAGIMRRALPTGTQIVAGLTVTVLSVVGYLIVALALFPPR